MPVAEALDRVLEILRTTELYSPQLGTKDEDPHTNDLVGGLMTVSSLSISRHKSLSKQLKPAQTTSFHHNQAGGDIIKMKIHKQGAGKACDLSARSRRREDSCFSRDSCSY